VVCLVAAVLVCRVAAIPSRQSDLEAARREMRAEVESIRELLHGKHLDD